MALVSRIISQIEANAYLLVRLYYVLYYTSTPVRMTSS